jgi:succinate dehydrogenase / fumarate reductase flavoprotein subunit/fumarate reductase flavoprotein subunit
MWADCGLVRTREGLLWARERLAELTERAARIAAPGPPEVNYAWQEALDLANQLTVARTIVESALVREESRGAHYRADFPERDDARWLRYIVLQRGADGAPAIETRPVAPTRARPEELSPVTS